MRARTSSGVKVKFCAQAEAHETRGKIGNVARQVCCHSNAIRHALPQTAKHNGYAIMFYRQMECNAKSVKGGGAVTRKELGEELTKQTEPGKRWRKICGKGKIKCCTQRAPTTRQTAESLTVRVNKARVCVMAVKRGARAKVNPNQRAGAACQRAA